MKSNAQRLAEYREKQRIRLEGFLSAIENHTSIFKDIPTNIGRIIWCDTTNELDKPKEERTGLKKLFTKEFRGVDYFVGSEGFAEIHFEGKRDNIIKREEYRFDSFAELLSFKTKIVINYVDSGTRFNFGLFDLPDEKGYTNQRLEYVSDCSVQSLADVFHDKIEEVWSDYKYEQLKKEYETTGYFLFNLVLPVKGSETQWGIIPYIKLWPDHFEVNDKRFDSTNLAKAYYDKNGLNIVLKKKSDSFLSKVGLDKKDYIPVQAVGSTMLFKMLFTNVLKVIFNQQLFELKDE